MKKIVREIDIKKLKKERSNFKRNEIHRAKTTTAISSVLEELVGKNGIDSKDLSFHQKISNTGTIVLVKKEPIGILTQDTKIDTITIKFTPNEKQSERDSTKGR